MHFIPPPGVPTQSSLRSSQVVAVIGTVVICAFGGTFILMAWSGPLAPSPVVHVIFGILWGLSALIIVGFWLSGAKALHNRAVAQWRVTDGSAQTRKAIVFAWATRRVKYLKPLVMCNLFGLMSTGGAFVIWEVLGVTAISVSACVFVFPTAKSAAKLLDAVEAAALAEDSVPAIEDHSAGHGK